MPTQPPDPHLARAVAESFGGDAERYDRARPAYPEALIRRVLDRSPGRVVLDVGCGTGTATRQFRAAGCTVTGVEPDPRMAAPARRDGIEVDVARFEDWDPAGRTYDAVVAGTAWHWVDPVAGASKAARVLRPGGLLVPFWHVADPPAPIAEAMSAAVRRVAPDLPWHPPAPDGRSMVERYQPIPDRAAEGVRSTGAFGEPEHWRFDWELRVTRDEYLDQLPTFGLLTTLAPEPLADLLAEVGAAIDALGGSVTIPYSTLAVAATLT